MDVLTYCVVVVLHVVPHSAVALHKLKLQVAVQCTGTAVQQSCVHAAAGVNEPESSHRYFLLHRGYLTVIDGTVHQQEESGMINSQQASL